MNKNNNLQAELLEGKRSLMKKSLKLIQNVARNVNLKFDAIWMKNVKGP